MPINFVNGGGLYYFKQKIVIKNEEDVEVNQSTHEYTLLFSGTNGSPFFRNKVLSMYYSEDWQNLKSLMYETIKLDGCYI